ncbi:serine acetyltransferase [Flavobacterium sp.]|uniref:serine acetyltransferase n=3 Tax=Flavobacterium sp. TaxID=239 RepID=UPI004047AA22
MIDSYEKYLYYLEQDRIALGIEKISIKKYFIDLIRPNYIYKFQKYLRKLEYYKNCKQNIFDKIYFLFLYYKFNKLSLKLGFSIPLNVFGPGLSIVHYGTIVVNSYAKVGKNCRLHPSTCIGASGGQKFAPQIGDNVYIAPGVKLYGNIRIANNIAFAANSAVGSSFLEEGVLVGGVPAKEIKKIDINKIIKHI